MLRSVARAAAQPLASLLFSSETAKRALLWTAYRPDLQDFQKENSLVELVGGQDYHDRPAFYERLLARANIVDQIDYLEFGVYKGASIRWWSTHNTSPKSRFFGFDSFEGLPESVNSSWHKGRFSVGRLLPDISDSRVDFQPGWFNNTVPIFLKNFVRGGRMIINLDADIYSSTMIALTHIGPHLQRGDIIIFDEFADTINEWRAYVDFGNMFNVKMTPILQQRQWMTVAFEVA